MRDPQGWIRFEADSVRRTLAAELPPDHFLHGELAARLVGDGLEVNFEVQHR